MCVCLCVCVRVCVCTLILCSAAHHNMIILKYFSSKNMKFIPFELCQHDDATSGISFPGELETPPLAVPPFPSYLHSLHFAFLQFYCQNILDNYKIVIKR